MANGKKNRLTIYENKSQIFFFLTNKIRFLKLFIICFFLVNWQLT